MNNFSLNLLHFSQGMTFMFFVIWSVRLFALRNNSRLMLCLFWITIFWTCIQLKNIVCLMGGMCLNWNITNNAAFYLSQIVVWSLIYAVSLKKDVKVDEAPVEIKSVIEPQPRQAEKQLDENSLKNMMIKNKLYLNANLTISELAFQIGTNRTYLSTVLNKNMKISFLDYVNSFRIKEACRIFESGKFSAIEEVAEKAGFNSLSTFRRAFKKEINMTPVQFIKECKIKTL